MSGLAAGLLVGLSALGLTLALIGLLAAARAAADTLAAVRALRSVEVVPVARLQAVAARLQTNAAMIPFEAQRVAVAMAELRVALGRLGIPQSARIARRLLLSLLG